MAKLGTDVPNKSKGKEDAAKTIVAHCGEEHVYL
jgi:hypothetical protein